MCIRCLWLYGVVVATVTPAIALSQAAAVVVDLQWASLMLCQGSYFRQSQSVPQPVRPALERCSQPQVERLQVLALAVLVELGRRPLVCVGRLLLLVGLVVRRARLTRLLLEAGPLAVHTEQVVQAVPLLTVTPERVAVALAVGLAGQL